MYVYIYIYIVCIVLILCASLNLFCADANNNHPGTKEKKHSKYELN